jgi:hypothetical protein
MFSPKQSAKHPSTGSIRRDFLIFLAIMAVLAVYKLYPRYCAYPVPPTPKRTWAYMQYIGKALEMYRLDQGAYPPVTEENASPFSARLRCLTTPIPYFNSVPKDLYGVASRTTSTCERWPSYYYDLDSAGKWRLISAGPDRVLEYGEVIFDASNGTKSRGDLVLTSDDPSIEKPTPVGGSGKQE